MRIVCLALFLVGCKTGTLDPFETPEDEYLGILITPEEVVIPVGQEIQLTATGLLDGRESRDITPVVDWVSDNPSVAEVSDALDAEGIITGVSAGQAEISAILGDVQSVPLTVKVTEAELLAVTVEPASVQLEAGGTVQLKANANFSDGSKSDASAQVRWITSDGSIVTVDRGLLTGQDVGDATVRAQWDDVDSNEVPVEVLASAEPDLRLSDLSASGGNGLIVADIAITNDGNAGASGFYVDIFLDPSGTPSVGDFGDKYSLVEYLGADESLELVATFEDVPSGTHDVFAYVDTEDTIDEANEGNNLASVNLEVTENNVLLPDLVVDSIDHLTDETSIYYYVEVSNYSDEDAGPFYVDLFLDAFSAPSAPDEGDYYEQVNALDAWSTVTVEFLVEETCNDCTSWILVDSTDDVDEQNENNNTKSEAVDNVP